MPGNHHFFQTKEEMTGNSLALGLPPPLVWELHATMSAEQQPGLGNFSPTPFRGIPPRPEHRLRTHQRGRDAAMASAKYL